MARYAALLLAVIALAPACTKNNPGTYQGYVEGEFVHVGSAVGGRLEHLLVQRGQTVAAGAPLFELESNEEAAVVRQAGEKMTSAKARLEDLGTGRRRPEVEVVRAQLAQAEAMEHQSAAQLARDSAQLAIGGVSKTQLEDSRAKHEVDLARVRELIGQLDVANLPARPDQIRAQGGEVEAAHAALDEAQWRLDQKHVAATQGGVVMDTLYREGEWVPAGAPIVRMLPPANIKVRFFVPEADLSRVALGKAVDIRCDGCAKSIAAPVTFKSTEAEFTPPVIYSNDTRAKLVFMIEAHPSPEDAPTLHPGQPVEIHVP